MMTFLIIFAAVLLVCVLIVLISKDNMHYYDDEDEYEVRTTTTTTVTHEQPQFNIVGNLNRRREGNQWYVQDPVDNEKIWVNEGDDMYEDAEGKIWNLK